MIQRIGTLAGWTALVLAGLLSYMAEGGWIVRGHAPDLERLPRELGTLRTPETITVDPLDLGPAAPDAFTFRSVFDAEGHEGRLYVAYYERAKRWSGKPHKISTCYWVRGWEWQCGDAVETPNGATVWLQRYTKGEDEIIVLNWVQYPEVVPGTGFLARLGARLRPSNQLRQDVASIYFEFDAEAFPPEEELARAADALIAELERLW